MPGTAETTDATDTGLPTEPGHTRVTGGTAGTTIGTEPITIGTVTTIAAVTGIATPRGHAATACGGIRGNHKQQPGAARRAALAAGSVGPTGASVTARGPSNTGDDRGAAISTVAAVAADTTVTGVAAIAADTENPRTLTAVTAVTDPAGGGPVAAMSTRDSASDTVEAVDAVTAELTKASPQGLAASKTLTTAGVLAGFDRDAERLAEESARLFVSAEAREGMLAFLEKRPPRWAAP